MDHGMDIDMVATKVPDGGSLGRVLVETSTMAETMEEVTLIGQVLCADLLEPSRPATQDNVWLPTCFTIYHPNNLTYEPLFTIAGTCMATCHNPCAHSLGVHAC